MYSLDFRIVIIKKGEIVEAKLSKFILMMPKTQVKNQDSSEDSREDSRYARTSRKSSR